MKERYQRLVGILLVLAAPVGCAMPGAYGVGTAIGYRHPKYVSPNSTDGSGNVPGDAQRPGRDYCRHLEKSAYKSALGSTVAGWTFGVAGLGAIGAGTALTATTNSDNDGSGRKALNAGLPIVGAVLALGAVYYITRAEASGELSATAAEFAVSGVDSAAAEGCSRAVADWNRSRAAANEALKAKVQADVVRMDALQKANDKAERERNEALAAAIQLTRELGAADTKREQAETDLKLLKASPPPKDGPAGKPAPAPGRQ